MDISEQFFQMCEQAYKYLGVPKKFTSEAVPASMPNLWHMPNPGTDRWVGKHRVLMGDIGEVPSMKAEGAFPIYRQDQLQSMVSADAEALVDHFYEWVYDQKGYVTKWQGEKPEKVYDTMDQLWLAFVMLEKHSRRWQKDRWMLA